MTSPSKGINSLCSKSPHYKHIKAVSQEEQLHSVSTAQIIVGNLLVAFARKHKFTGHISMWTAEEVELRLTKCCLLNTQQEASCPEDGVDKIICVFIYLLQI